MITRQFHHIQMEYQLKTKELIEKLKTFVKENLS